MITILKKLTLIPLVMFILVLISSFPSFAETITDTPTSTPTIAPTPTQGPTPTPDNSKEINSLQGQINELQKKVSDLQGQERTLSSQIAVMDSQMKLTQLRINATRDQIAEINEDIDTTSKRIDGLQDSLDQLTKVLLNRIRVTYEVGSVQPFHVLLYSSSASDFVERVNYLRIAQQHDKQLIYDTQQAKNDYANQKEIFEDKKRKILALKTQLEAYTKELEGQKRSKQQLLSETQGSEATYQRLLSQAKAQLDGFSKFTASQGGASILSNQTSCDSWGCYYNQRDSSWGSQALNHTQYTLASDGCLVTSMAMVYTHYGHKNVTPATINSNPSNFASYYPAYLNKIISADGVTIDRMTIASSYNPTLIDGELSSGRPVVIGISYDGGPISDHFVVLVSGSNGNYQMNDPFTPSGSNISFTSKYSLGGIRAVDRVAIR